MFKGIVTCGLLVGTCLAASLAIVGIEGDKSGLTLAGSLLFVTLGSMLERILTDE